MAEVERVLMLPHTADLSIDEVTGVLAEKVDEIEQRSSPTAARFLAA